MSLNLLETAKQIDVMATNISERQNEHLEKIKKSINAINNFSIKKFRSCAVLPTLIFEVRRDIFEGPRLIFDFRKLMFDV